MSDLKKYNIDLKSMTEDRFNTDFFIEDDFFEALDQTDIHGGHLNVRLEVKKLAEEFELHLDISGDVVIECDRCLDDMVQPILTTGDVRVKYGKEYLDDGGDVIIVPEREGIINVAWLIYEFTDLAIPILHVHPDGQCNPEMMALLLQHKGTIPEEATDELESKDLNEEESDPRWDKLKNLLNNN